MREADYDKFASLLDSVAALMGKPAPAPTAAAMFFRALERYTLASVRAALDAHMRDPQRGRFMPLPADVIAQLEGMAQADGRPGAEEAWAMSLLARDEAETVVWTAEMAQAWAISRPVLDMGDEVGARMAFKEAYLRMVTEARALSMPPAWSASLGHDPDRRRAALTAAVSVGRLPASDLPALPGPAMPLLALEQTRDIPDAARAALRRLRESIAAGTHAPSEDVAERQRTQALKARAAASVAAYEAIKQAQQEPAAPAA